MSHRINLVLDDFRAAQLDNLAAKDQKSKTQLIKEALDLLFKSKDLPNHEDDLQEFFGIFKDGERANGLEYQKKIRDEWERE